MGCGIRFVDLGFSSPSWSGAVAGVESEKVKDVAVPSCDSVGVKMVVACVLVGLMVGLMVVSGSGGVVYQRMDSGVNDDALMQEVLAFGFGWRLNLLWKVGMVDSRSFATVVLDQIASRNLWRLNKMVAIGNCDIFACDYARASTNIYNLIQSFYHFVELS